MKIKQYISFQTKCIYTSKTNFVIYWIQLRENKILEIMNDYKIMGRGADPIAGILG